MVKLDILVINEKLESYLFIKARKNNFLPDSSFNELNFSLKNLINGNSISSSYFKSLR
jgi:hypothetical protein